MHNINIKYQKKFAFSILTIRKDVALQNLAKYSM